MKTPARLTCLCLTLMMALGPLARAQDVEESTYELNTLQKQIREGEERSLKIQREADAVAEETEKLRRKLVGTAAKVQQREADVTAAEAELDRLTKLEAEKSESLKKNSQALVETLAALQLLQKNPPPALFVHPDDAADAARAAILMSEIAPALKEQADALAKEIDDLRLAREAVTNQRATLARADQDLEAERQRLAETLAERENKYRELSKLAATQTSELTKLAGKAASIEDLLSEIRKVGTLVAPRRKPSPPPETGPLPTPRPSPFKTEPVVASLPPGRELTSAPLQASAGLKVARFSAAKGAVRLPANGRMIAKFDSQNGKAGKTKGITIATRPGAQVVAPFDGEIAFAGPYLGYGQLLIISAGEGYHLILSGLDQVSAVVGQRLLAGEPIGQMGPAKGKTRAEEANSGNNANLNPQGWPELYFELRKDGQAFDPVPWLALK
ncbi:MAG: hypothetical protein EP347_08775 [Alphaproteobacteria bacterium]|nr:MAG: hypothetical protein EP347_08775 [Alphaproteobacteria bacterium]